MVQARAIAVWGYDLLRQFCRDTAGYDLGPVDMSRAIATHTELDEKPLIIMVLEDALGRRSRDGFEIAWLDGADICVRTTDIVKWAKSETDYTLPGGTRAVEQWLRERFHTSDERSLFKYLRLHGAAAELRLSK